MVAQPARTVVQSARFVYKTQTMVNIPLGLCQEREGEDLSIGTRDPHVIEVSFSAYMGRYIQVFESFLYNYSSLYPTTKFL